MCVHRGLVNAGTASGEAPAAVSSALKLVAAAASQASVDKLRVEEVAAGLAGHLTELRVCPLCVSFCGLYALHVPCVCHSMCYV